MDDRGSDAVMERSRRARLAAAFDRRFARFAAVGASGVVVNLAALFLLADVLRTNANLASAGAIAVSIGSNFLLNDAWTFGDRRALAGARHQRLLRFYTVSLGGAAVQWGVFVGANVLLSPLVQGPGSLASAGWKYLYQLSGIAIGTLWNFTANLLWTWRPRATS